MSGVEEFLRCVACGTALSIETTADDERCPNCGAELEIARYGRYRIGPVTIDGPALEKGAACELTLVGFVQAEGLRGAGVTSVIRSIRVTDWEGPRPARAQTAGTLREALERPARAQTAGTLREALERLEASMESLRALKALRVAVKALEEIVEGEIGADESAAELVAGRALLAIMRELDGPSPDLGETGA